MAMTSTIPLHHSISPDADAMDIVSLGSASTGMEDDSSRGVGPTSSPAFPSPTTAQSTNPLSSSSFDNHHGFFTPLATLTNNTMEGLAAVPRSSDSPVPIIGPLHRSNHMVGLANAVMIDQTASKDNHVEAAEAIMTPAPSLEHPPSHNNSQHSNQPHHNIIEAILRHEKQNLGNSASFRSMLSVQSSRSSQSWGQLTDIDWLPTENDMEAPTYVLEESPSSQELWRQTAGNRPPQPVEERAFFEKMWAENFARSKVQYGVPVKDLVTSAAVTAAPMLVVDDEDGGSSAADPSMYSSIFSIAAPSHGSPKRQEDVAEAILLSRMNDLSNLDSASTRMSLSQRQLLDEDTTVLLKGFNTFGTTVSKSFAQTEEDGLISVTTVNISIASYRVVESKRRGRYAQFHVIYREGNMRDTIGVWKRYRDFEMLANKISGPCEGCQMLQHHVEDEPEIEFLPNAITSWRLMKKRKRWYRCLDAGYLSLKVFLLERFLHDVLFESSTPHLLRDFVLANAADDDAPMPVSP